MTRMSAGSDAALVNLNFQAWVTFIADYKKNKDMEDAVKAAEQKFNDFKKGKSDKAKGVLDKMAGANDTGLKAQCFGGWLQIVKDEKEGAEMEAMLANSDGKFKLFSERNGKNAKEVMRKATQQVEICCILKVFNPWKMDTRLEKLLRANHSRMEGKRGQLQSVQLLFRNFAQQLESGLKDGTPRDAGKPKRLSKDSNTVSLPDIHGRPSE